MGGNSNEYMKEYMKKYATKIRHCDVCNKDVKCIRYYTHVKSKKHRSLVKEPIVVTDEIAKLKDQIAELAKMVKEKI